MSPKLTKQLADKKHRTATGLFLVEGEKSIHELLGSDYVVETIFGTDAFLNTLTPLLRIYEEKAGVRPLKIIPTAESELLKMGTLVTNNAGIAVAVQKPPIEEDMLFRAAQDGFLLALDDVRDPGNLGTIVRTADWFGITHIIASPTTTDCYNPKTVAATMGSFTRIRVNYCELSPLLQKMHNMGIPILGASMTGASTHEAQLPKKGVLVMGSESHGLSSALIPYVTTQITIPKYGGAESLNVSVATGILLDTLRRAQS